MFLKDNLGNDLHIYLPGLTPLSSFASLAVRPELLRLFARHILNLNPLALRSPLKAIILCLLPALEDESSEDHDDWLQILDDLRDSARNIPPVDEIIEDKSVLDSYFWQCLFVAIITNSSRRQGALVYLAKNLPRFANSPGQTSGESPLPSATVATLSPEPGLLVRCMAAGLIDDQLLIQRGFLDLLVTHVPLHSVLLQDTVPQPDMDKLILAASNVVARRDMSLNRRLWAWLLALDAKNQADLSTTSSPVDQSPGLEYPRHAAYFARYGLPALTRSIKVMFESRHSSFNDRAKPFKLCLSLMDRWEVGGLLIPNVLVPALESALEFTRTYDEQTAAEMLTSACNFFDGIESGLIWAKFNELVSTSFSSSSEQFDRSFDLCVFVVNHFNLQDEDMVMHHIPQACLHLICQLTNCFQTVGAAGQNEAIIVQALDILDKLQLLVPMRAFSVVQNLAEIAPGQAHDQKLKPDDIIARIHEYYASQQITLDDPLPIFNPLRLGQLILRQSLNLLFLLFPHTTDLPVVESLARFIFNMSPKVPDSFIHMQQARLLEVCITTLHQADESASMFVPFRMISSITLLLIAWKSCCDDVRSIDQERLSSIQALLVEHIWLYLSPRNPRHHVEAVRCLWQLDSIDPSRKIVEAALTSLIIRHLVSDMLDLMSAVEVGQRFSVLWSHSVYEQMAIDKNQKTSSRHNNSTTLVSLHPGHQTSLENILSRPLLILLEQLSAFDTKPAIVVRSWLQDAPSVFRIFQIIINQLQNLKCIANVPNTSIGNQMSHVEDEDVQECIYYLKHLHIIVKCASDNVWTILATASLDENESKPPEAGLMTLQEAILELSLKAFSLHPIGTANGSEHRENLARVALDVALGLLGSPYNSSLTAMNAHGMLLKYLEEHIGSIDPLLQVSMLNTITTSLRPPLNPIMASGSASTILRRSSRDALTSASKLSLIRDTTKISSTFIEPPLELLASCLKVGLQARSARMILDSWVEFLQFVLPFFSHTIFKILMPLSESLCSQASSILEQMQKNFHYQGGPGDEYLESSLIGFLNGLEHLLDFAHDQLDQETIDSGVSKTIDAPQGFFGNMVQGVFSTESEKTPRTSNGNNRLTILLCFQDVVRVCYSIWSWGPGSTSKQDGSVLASFTYMSLKMRNRARRLLERLLSVESPECIETLITLWSSSTVDAQSQSILELLNVLNGSRPKLTIHVIFTAIHSRTSPSAVEPARQPSFSSELHDVDLARFLLEYAHSIEDDAMAEIWNDCMIFMKEVLANPLAYSRILSSLLVFAALLAEKVHNTNFGEQRRIRRELAEPSHASTRQHMRNGGSSSIELGVLSALITVIPKLKIVLGENDRIINAVNSITVNVTAPTLRAKTFPSNVDKDFLAVLKQLSTISQGSKLWKKDVNEAISDARFFTTSLTLIKDAWLEILRAFIHHDRDKVSELLAKLTAPTTTGIVFGGSATSARNAADRATQLNLRRVALLVLACQVDTFAQDIPALVVKLTELLAATSTSSPSSATSADVYMVLRALILRATSTHLAPIWPIINSEMRMTISSLLPNHPQHEKYTSTTIVQACKLLDLLITLRPDEFQLHEWLYITDSVDAVYQTDRLGSRPLIDSIADSLATIDVDITPAEITPDLQSIISTSDGNRRIPILDVMMDHAAIDVADQRAMQKQDLVMRILKPFFDQLSLISFEAMYEMAPPALEACSDGVLKDLFADGADLVL